MRDKLVHMANQIGTYFKIQPDEDARLGIAQHIKMYWTPRMRRDLIAYADQGGEDLQPLVKAALERLREAPIPVETKFPG